MADNEVQTKFTADVTSLLRGMKDAGESVETAAGGMKGDLGALAESFEKLGVAALGIGAVGLAMEAAREAFEWVKEAINSTNELSETFVQLSITAGMSQEEFNKYNAAVTMAGGSAKDLESITRGMERGIKSNSEVLIANGIATDKAALSHMDLGQYIAKVVEVMETYGSATDKDQLLMEAFGRSGMQFARVLVEMNEKMGEAQKLADKGGPITAQALQMLEESKAATARLKLAQEEYAAIVAQNASGISNSWKNIKANLVEAQIAGEMATRAMHQGLIQVAIDATTGELDIRKLKEEYQDFLKIQKEVGEGSMDAGAKFGPKDRNTGSNTSNADLEAAKAAAKAAAAEKLRIAKAAEAELHRDAEEMQKVALEHRKKFEEVSQSEVGRLQLKWAADDAKAKEAIDTAFWKGNVERSNWAYKEHMKEVEMIAKAWKKGIDAITQNWDVGIQAMLHGQLTLVQGFAGAMRQFEDQTEKALINAGLNWAKYSLLSAAEQDKAHFHEVIAHAKGAAAGAYDATAGIPFVGPFLAPAAAAVAFTGVMAFAEGGWDRVPSDQVAMIHKNEMVLPASIAEPVRQMAAAGGGGGQQIHFHGVTDASWWKHNQGNIVKTIGEAMRNGRKS